MPIGRAERLNVLFFFPRAWFRMATASHQMAQAVNAVCEPLPCGWLLLSVRRIFSTQETPSEVRCATTTCPCGIELQTGRPFASRGLLAVRRQQDGRSSRVQHDGVGHHHRAKRPTHSNWPGECKYALRHRLLLTALSRAFAAAAPTGTVFAAAQVRRGQEGGRQDHRAARRRARGGRGAATGERSRDGSSEGSGGAAGSGVGEPAASAQKALTRSPGSERSSRAKAERGTLSAAPPGLRVWPGHMRYHDACTEALRVEGPTAL